MELFKIFGRIAVNNEEAHKELDNTTGKAKEASKKIGKFFGSIAKTVGKASLAAIGAAATGIAALTKSAVENYAEYEQLVGGVETLFKDSSSKVLEYANRAYKTAGLSANDYMETVTSFSASLLQSLGGDTEKAAEIGNMAVIDMADNANKMGSSMESIQNAYAGFAKQNYTMLDNLKLGYGGTKEEMQRLIDDANALNAAQGNLTNYSIESYADIVSAIHDVQTEMGITGTTVQEAATTIQGSLSSTKAAWDNWLTGTGSIDALVETVVNSAGLLADAIGKILPNLTSGISQLISKLAPEIPPLINQLLPSIISSIVTLISSFGSQLPAILATILPVITQTAPQIINTLIMALISSLPIIVSSALQLILALATGITQSLPELIPAIVEVVLQIVTTLIGNIELLVDAAIALISALAEGLIAALPILIEQAPTIIAKLVQELVAVASQWDGSIYKEGTFSVDHIERVSNGSIEYSDTYYSAKTTGHNKDSLATDKTGTFWDDLKHFKREEMRCPCGKCGGFPVEPSEKLMRTLDTDIWEHFQAPITIVPLPPNDPHAGGSGVRCQAYNDSLRGSVPNSRHVQGKAADIIVRGFSGSAVKAYCDSLVKAGKLRYCYVIGGGNSVHVDIL